ncbi:MAG: LysM domain-containing protein [Nesterenkonia sp.]|nr:LysM domain-containing protein [Nesterenkonia sp.]
MRRSTPTTSGAHPGRGTREDSGSRTDAVLTAATVLAGPLLVLCGLSLLESGPWVGRGLTGLSAGDLLGTSVGGPRAAELLIGLSAALVGAALSLGSAVAGAASLVMVLVLRLGRSVPAGVEALSPAYMRRGIALTLGLQMAVGGIAAPSALAAPAQQAPLTPVVAEESEEPGATDHDQAPDTDQHDASDTDQHISDQQEDPVAPLFIPQSPEPAEDRHQQAETRPSPDGDSTVTVRPGDTLWDIAAAGLGPGACDWEIAEEWPRWHEANVHLIGEDPALLNPGTVLERPAPQHG